MAARVRAFDWSTTVLGPVERWPEALRVAVDICLSSRFPMFVWWGPQLINIYNDGYVPMLGARHPAALGRPARDSWNDIWDVVGPQADAVMKRGEATWNERVKLVMTRKGYTEDTYFTWSYSPIRESSGRVGGLFCAVTEETERVRAEEALQRNRDTFYHLIQNNPFGIYVVDADFRMREASLGSQKVFANVRPLIGRDFGEVLRSIWEEPFASEAIARFRHTLETGEPHAAMRTMERRADIGEVEAYDWRIERITLPDGRFGVVCYFYDLSERRRFELALREQREELARAKEAAEAASAAKSDFLATLSHELRTPLTPVLLTVSLMESHPELPAELREDVATIRRNIELESRLISDLLDLTRVERGKLDLDLQDVDLHLIVRSAIDICQREASAKMHVELNAGEHTVRGDGTRLQQIFWNLVNNAMKFTGPDGVISVRTSNPDEGLVRVEVIDTGVGIDAVVLPRLFTAFEQGDVRAGRRQAGLGLGLAISRRLAEMHGGTISAASAGRGKGTTFGVELPTVGRPAEASEVSSDGDGENRQGDGRSLSVLLVEDHEPTLRVMERLLRRAGHRVTPATSVATALAAAAQDGFDLIISDLGLPDGSGLDVMRRLQDEYAGRAIALTGYGMESDVAASRVAGFKEHLTKPVDLPSLEAAIRRVTQSGEEEPAVE